MKRIIAIFLTTALLVTGCGRISDNNMKNNPEDYIADYMSVNSENGAEFYIMRVNNDYLEIPGKCNFIYLDTDGAYPELENGQIAKVTADIDIYDGGEAGYTGNYFIKQLHDSVILQYKDVIENVDVPIATETEEMKYGRHMLQYQLNDDLYFIVLNRQYIDVYLNEKLFIEYEWSSFDNILSPFFEEVREKYTEQSDDISENRDSMTIESSDDAPTLNLPVSLDEQETLDVSQFSDQAIVLPAVEIPQNAVCFEAFKPEIYDRFIITNETELELYKQLFNIPLERVGLYSDDTTAKSEYDSFMNEIDNISAQYPFDSYTFVATHLYVPYYRHLLGADIVIDNNMIGVVERFEHYDDDGKDKPSLSPKDYYWIAAIPKNHLTDDSYIGWNTPQNIGD